MIGTASGALAQLGLPDDVVRQQQANIAAGYAVTYILGYILTLMFVPFVAPWLMGVDLKEEAAKLEAELSGGKERRKAEISGTRNSRRDAYRVAVGCRADGWCGRGSYWPAMSSSSESSVAAMTSNRTGRPFSKPAMKSSSLDRQRPSSGPEPRSAPRSKAPRCCAKCRAMRSASSSTIERCMAAP